MKRRIFYVLCSVAGVLALSCDQEEPSVEPQPEYLPMQHGFFIVYEVDSLGYAGIGNTVHSTFQLKTVVVDSFRNAQSTYTYVMHRYRRPSQLHSWTYLDTWSARKDGRRTVVAEESTEYVKFIVPPADGQIWDGNLFNGQGEDEYEMESHGSPYQVGTYSFDDCIVVNQNDEDDGVVFADERREIYARDVGLVGKEARVITYCTSGCPSIGEIQSGYEYSQRIIDYGVE